jgi:LuxR family maltose regulon positive regulatory protein
VARLAGSQAAVVCLVAPAGYGKTTTLAQWAAGTDRVAWVELDPHDNDPAVLLTSVAVALDRIEPIQPSVSGVASIAAAAVATAVARLAAAVSAMTKPVAIVLDQLDALDERQCLDAVAQLAAQLPSGSQFVLASRTRPPLPLARLRSQGRVVEIGAEDLAMDQREARALAEAAGVRLSESAAAELLRRTEGWPVGLYLATRAMRTGARPGARRAGTAVAYDRPVGDYLWSELLSGLPPETVTFLTRTSVLERMCGPLCDAVLDTHGSGDVLASMESTNLLLVPLDRRRQWYRYHHLLRDFLRAELSRREPELVADLHLRAAAWCEASGMPETAIDHAQAAGDTGRVAHLAAELTQPAYAGGRVESARRWLTWLEDNGPICLYPAAAVHGAWLEALAGQPAAAERWAAVAERGPPGTTMPDGSTMEGYLGLLRALLCRDGVERMLVDTQAAVAGLSPGSSWRATALLLEGIAWLLADEADRADPMLAHAVQVATDAGAAPTAAAGLAERAIIAMQRGQWDQAAALAEQARACMRAGHVDDYAMSPLVNAVMARTAAHQGDARTARRHLVRTAPLRPLLTHAMPHRAVQTLQELARAYLAVGDAAAARTILREARDILLLRPSLGVLSDQADELRSTLDLIPEGRAGASSLTAAELRLLPLLSTHLTFAEIGERLYRSPHTVKSQAMSVYRKLGVSSRSQAVKRARQIGVGG